MERLKNITIIFLLAVGLLNSIAPPICFANRSSGTKPASVLLQAGLYAEEIEGDLDAAIKIYEQVIAEAKDTQRIAAQATYRIGMCYLKKGEKTKAAGQFRKLIVKFPEHESLVTKAQEHLAKLKPVGVKNFGPVVERIIYTDETGKDCFFDLDKGKAFSIPQGLTRSSEPEKGIPWILENGIDFVNCVGRLQLWDMVAVEVEEKMWDSAGAVEINSILMRGPSKEMLPTGREEYTITSPFTYAFETREGGIGLLQILEKRSTYLKTRYKMLQEPAKIAPVEVFGPVIERVVNDDGERKNILIDLDSGELFSAPRNLRSKEEQRWFVEKGIDAGCETNPAGPGLWGLDMVVIPIGEQYLETVKPGILRSELASGKPGSPAVMSGLGQLPASYMFKTREGGMGVLQILEVRNDVKPRHIRIRYKMLQEPGTVRPTFDFGPEVERVIYSEETGKPFFFDLDTAKAFSPPPGLTRYSPEREVIEWSATKGIDFVNSRGHLELVEMTTVKVESDMWESATPAEIKDALLKGSTQNFLPTRSKDYTISSPITYVFKTREGGIGILQILEKKDNNLRIRYKMLQERAKTVAGGWRKRRPDMTILYRELAPEDASKITEKISEQGIAYELRAGGTSIYAPKKKVYQLRLDMAKEGLPEGGQQGYRIFDNERIGISPTVQNINLKRALEEELAMRFLPDADTPGVNAILDLASGELLPAGEGVQQLTVFREMGKGDLAYDRVLICLRGGKAKLLQAGKLTNLKIKGQIEDSTAYELPSLPCSLVVTTSEGDNYEVAVTSADNSGANLEYKKMLAEPAEVASVASFGPAKVASLYDIDHPTTTEKECAIDFDTGKLSKIPPQARQMPGDDLMKWLSGSGIDAVAEIAGKDRGLIGIDVAVKMLASDEWDTITPQQLRALLVATRAPRQDTKTMLFEDAPPQPIFSFRTRDSGLGILQILDVDKSKQMVQFRYKMLQGETAQLRVSSHKVFLPECDTTVYDLLDLASSRIINSEPGGEVLDLSKPDGKGNLYFDKAKGQLWLVGVRGTRMRLRSGGELLSSEPDFIARGRNAYYLLGEIPCKYQVTTTQGDKYELKVLSMDAGDRPGVHIEYWKSAESPGTFAVATGVRGDAAKAMELLSGLKALMFGVVGAVESDDPNTALLLLDKLIAQSKQFKSTVKDTSVEAAVKAGIELLDPLRDALEKKQMDRVKSLLAALNQMGPAVESAIEKEAAQQGQSKKRTDIRRR